MGSHYGRHRHERGAVSPRGTEAQWAGLAAAIVLIGTLVTAYAPIHGPICVSRALFHLPCPGCGLTRSLTAIWHGDLLLSFRYHPMGLPTFVGCMGVALRALSPPAIRPRWRWFERFGARLLAPPLGIGIFAGMIVLWVVRLGLWSSGSRFFLW